MNRLRLLGVIMGVAVLLLSVACSGDSPSRSSRGNFQLQITTSGGDSTLGGASSGLAAESGDSGVGFAASHDDDSSDDAVRRLQELNVTFSSFLARNLDGELVDVTVDLPVTIDLLSIKATGSATLPGGSLPPGIYDQLVVVMTAVELVLKDDTRVEITPPGGGWTAVIPACPFEVVDGAETTVMVKINLRRSIKLALGGGFRFEPHIECEDADNGEGGEGGEGDSE